MKGAIACGHPVTAAAARDILRAGGNAADAVVAAAATACVVEPVLASLAGGGFLLFAAKDRPPEIFDFFVQTPHKIRPASELDYHPITADFGETHQIFHIGRGAAATPGVARGLWEIQSALGGMPMSRLLEPAIEAARQGVAINRFQDHIFHIVAPIYLTSSASRACYASGAGTLLQAGDILQQPALATTLESYGREGADLFYRGELAHRLVQSQVEGGGQLNAQDLENYQVYRRNPLQHEHRGVSIYTNPPPSSGGMLIVFALALLEPLSLQPGEFGHAVHMAALSQALLLTHQARVAGLDISRASQGLDPTLLQRYRKEVLPLRKSRDGTTHISIIDHQGSVAAMTLSNGEGCGHMIPGSGVMLNNMLGEEDINPGGFQKWQSNQRMTSMMAPTMLRWPDDRRIALGSGGSNRIRSALCQVISNLIDFGLPLDKAVGAARLHVEGNRLDVEPGFDSNCLRQLRARFESLQQWQQKNLFFGGANSVEAHGNKFFASGDPRRGGVGLLL